MNIHTDRRLFVDKGIPRSVDEIHIHALGLYCVFTFYPFYSWGGNSFFQVWLDRYFDLPEVGINCCWFKFEAGFLKPLI
jgi:hypothetical protein